MTIATVSPVATTAGLLARGPWAPDQVVASWRPDPYRPAQHAIDAADVALNALRERGSPSHDGFAGRLVGFEATAEKLTLELQPIRWALRLLTADAAQSLSVQCIVRDDGGRWLAGRRADWLASWAGRWALGAAGSVEVDENPAETMLRELQEEWSIEPERMQIEALVQLPSGMVMLIGQAWVAEGTPVTPDEEHDDFAWWPREQDDWPGDSHEALHRVATLLAQP